MSKRNLAIGLAVTAIGVTAIGVIMPRVVKVGRRWRRSQEELE